MFDIKFIQSEDFKFFGNVEVYDGGLRIGIAKLSRKGNTATLSDIIIHNQKRRVISFLPIYKGTNYRDKGIGTRLLINVIAFCKQNNISGIQGKIVGDLKVLIPWYKKHGFIVNEKNELHMELHT